MGLRFLVEEGGVATRLASSHLPTPLRGPRRELRTPSHELYFF